MREKTKLITVMAVIVMALLLLGMAVQADNMHFLEAMEILK